MRSSRRRRLSSGRSSTASPSADRVHRRTPLEVRGRADLQGAAGEPESGTWDLRLHALLCDARRVLVKRPQLAAGDANAGGSAIELVRGGAFGREATRLATAVLGLLEEGGFGRNEQLTCFRTLFIYVTGYPEPESRAPLSSLDSVPTQGSNPQEVFAVGLEALIHGLVHLLLKDASTNGQRADIAVPLATPQHQGRGRSSHG